jgi:cysteinyl-tRNA synthetase
VAPTPQHSHSSGPGVVGVDGRYPLHERPAPALRIAGQEVRPVGPLRMYTCGITPYDVTHAGHAATFVWADLIATLAHATGSEALVARNVTDIDDVLTEAARTRGWHFDELALTQEFLFDRDMKTLSVTPPALAPHARAHIPAVVRLASALVASGAAYEVDGHVMFRGGAVPSAAGLDEDAAFAASAEYGDQEDLPERESRFDVPVWRPSSADHPAWPSPWGWGRPGWHAECAAMAVCSLGASVDVLLGGSDLTFPHHAYQAAMVEAATGVRPFATAVVHVGEVRRDGTKMAKSTGNLVLVTELLDRHAPSAVRFGLLNRRWPDPWDCEESVFAGAAAELGELHHLAGDRDGPSVRHDEVLDALTDDLDVPRAVAVARDGGAEAVRYLLDLLKVRHP